MLVDGEQIDRAGALLEPLSVGQIELDHRTRKIVCPSRGGSKKVIAAAQILDDHEIEVEDIALRRPSLDDVFLKLTGHRAEEIPSEDGDSA